jgi:Flp pilus assembly protein TadD
MGTRAALLTGPISFVLLAGCVSSSSLPAERSPAEQPSGDAATLMRVADRMHAEGANDTALSVYRQAANADASRPEPLIGQGQSLQALGNYGAAAEAYSAALRLAPENGRALRGLAIALIHNGQPQLALGPIDKLKAKAPGDARNYALAGVAYDLAGDHAAAQAQYRAGLSKAPADAGQATNLALSLALSNNFAAAVALLKPLVERPDATARLRQNLALIYGLAGDRDNAARVARFDLDDAAVRSNLGYYQQLRDMAPDARTRALLIGAPHAPASGSLAAS